MSINTSYYMNNGRYAQVHTNVQKPLRTTQSNQPKIKASLDLSVTPSSGLLPFVSGATVNNTVNTPLQRDGKGSRLNRLA
jgi:hypothetical protein